MMCSWLNEYVEIVMDKQVKQNKIFKRWFFGKKR